MVTNQLLSRVEKTVAEVEANTSCEIKVAIERSLTIWERLSGWTARKRAIVIFSQQRVWDTELNNGILIYLLYKKKNLEIVADRGISTPQDQERWRLVCQEFENEVRKSGLEEEALINLIKNIGTYCASRFPALESKNDNEVLDSVVIER